MTCSGELVARAQYAGRLPDPEGRVGQPWSAPRRQRDIVDAGLAQQPCPGDALVRPIRGDVFRAAKTQPGPELERLLEPRRMQVEVVEAEDRRAAMQVKALQLRVKLLHLIDELQRVPERVPHPEHAPDAGFRSVG